MPLDHLDWAGEYIVDKLPDVVVLAGDFADMESLSSYDVGQKSYEGRRYKADIETAHVAMGRLLAPIKRYNAHLRSLHKSKYRPRMVITLGNHEDRITRAINADPKLEGTIGLKDLGYEKFGFEVYPYISPVCIDGIHYCHFWPSGQMGRPCTSARAVLTRYHQSCVAGHQQGRDIAFGKRADGVSVTAIIAGSYYLHDENYLLPFTNQHWRGIIMLHNVKDGSFDEMMVPIGYLKEKYGS